METTLDFPTIDMAAHHAPAEPLFERPAPAPRMLEQTAIARGIESVAGAVGEFDRIAAGLAAIEASHPKDVVCDVRSPAGMRQAVAGRAAWRDPRVAVERARKAAKAPVLALGRDIDTFAARLETTLRIGESNYDEQIKVREAEIAAEKAERERIEAERVAKHQAGIARIRSYVGQASGKPAARIAAGIAFVEGLTFGPEWDEFAVPAADAQCETLEALRSLLATTQAAEAAAAAAEAQRIEQARVAEEQRAERERLAAEAAQFAKAQREAADKLAAEQAEFARQRAAFEAEQAQVAVNAAEIPEGRDSQHVLKAEAAVPDATDDRETPVDASPSVGSMGAGQPADAGPPVDDRPPINLTQISARLGFKVTRALLDQLGLPPSHTVKASVYWPAAAFGPICAALIKHIEAVAA